MIFIKNTIYAILFFPLLISCKKENKKPELSNQTASIKEESLKTLYLLTDALITLQIKEKSDPGFGAIYCKDCHEEKIYHTRAAEAVFPFAVAYKHSGDSTYLRAAIYLGNWLIKQQLPDGAWKETPEEWTGTTADGCQILFSLYANEDDRYRTAAIKNLHYMRGMIKNGLIGYGPQYWEIYNSPPCIYPTFARAENLALAIEYGGQEKGILPSIPTDIKGWAKYFPTLDVVQVRSENFMATITAYNYKDPKRKSKSKYMHRPAGGALCNLWAEGHGFLQTSSQTKYSRWKPMHFPEAPGIKCLTPRIEYTDSSGYYTNLYEFDADICVSDAGVFPKKIKARGELKNEEHVTSGISYILSHIIDKKYVQRTVAINFTPGAGFIKIIEPIVEQKGMWFNLQNEQTVLIEGGKRAFKFEITEGAAKIELGKDAINEGAHYAVHVLLDGEGKSRCDYNLTEGKWYAYEIPWHTGR